MLSLGEIQIVASGYFHLLVFVLGRLWSGMSSMRLFLGMVGDRVRGAERFLAGDGLGDVAVFRSLTCSGECAESRAIVHLASCR